MHSRSDFLCRKSDCVRTTEADVLVHIEVNGEDSSATVTHPFLVDGKWISAKDLRAGDQLTLADGTKAPIEKIRYEKLTEPVLVYNFEVADFHTYYVGNSQVLVHNKCNKTGNTEEVGLGGNQSVVQGESGSNLSFKTGKEGEEYLAKLVGGKPQAYFKTSHGGRYIDQLAGDIAYESKVGYTTLTSFVKKQILKDAELIEQGAIKGAKWNFFKSDVTGKMGASKPLLDFLKQNGIA